jgi:general secretion pathway protein B
MSSILKALRKLEEDKSATGQGSADIARNILKRRAEDFPDPTNWLLIGSAGLLLMLLAAVGWSTWPEKPPGVTAVPQPTSPVSHGAGQTQARGPAAAPAVGGSLGLAESPQRFPAAKSDLPVAALPVMVIPDLLVSQIIDNPQLKTRLAIINDLPVMEETLIEGAKVIEILSDRVLFSYQGFEFVMFVRKNAP